MPTYISFTCNHCKAVFSKTLRLVAASKRSGGIKFCSQRCSYDSKKLAKAIPCLRCGKIVIKSNSNYLKSPNTFCSRSCAVTYNNIHKTKGTRRSKIEKWLEKQLTVLYPNLEIHFNRKDAIQSELDIYIPSIKLAIELNGIFHYEPIYGCEKLSQIQNNDNKKSHACREAGIELCIIDTSKLRYFKLKNIEPFLQIIVNLLATKKVFPAQTDVEVN